MKCLLCIREKGKLAKAHIFPIGFFNNIETKGQVLTYRTSGEKGRRLQKAIYDKEIVCQDCERDILMPLDDYAIKVLRDKEGLIKIYTGNKNNKLYIFNNIDRKKLRLFFASVLWRVSISKQLEVKNLTVGKIYEERIRDDLLSNGAAEYIDVFVQFRTDPMHNAFFLPYRKKFKPIDKRRDTQNINGWILQFPNIHILLSMDQRHLPNRIYGKIADNNNLPVSTSIHPDSDAFKFAISEREKDEAQLNQIIKGFINIMHE